VTPSRWLALAAAVLVIAGCSGAETGPPGATAVPSAARPATAGQAATEPVDVPADGAPPPSAGAEVPALAEPLSCDGEAVLCVATGGSGAGTAEAPYGRVQDAVDAAAPGSVVQVAAGEFAEHVVARPGVALRGGFAPDFASRPADPTDEPGGAATTTLVGRGEGPTVLIDLVDDVEVEGFTITGGTGACIDGVCDGGGIAADGAGIRIARNRIVGNVLPLERESNGGGIAVRGRADVVGNVIEGNEGGNGAGIIADGDIRLIGNVVRGNTSAGDHGGGAFLTGTLVVQGNLFEGNRVGESLGYGWGGGLIIASEGTTFQAAGNTYRDNVAVIGGAGPFIDDGADGTLHGELVVGNRCTEADGRGAVYVDALDASGDTGSVVTITSSTIADNDCGSGLNVEAAGSAAVVRDSIITDNAGPAVATATGGTAEVSHTLADEVLPGPGNLTGDPGFVGADDYRLQPASPAVGAGADGGDLGAHAG
jgi:hypothetical protein